MARNSSSGGGLKFPNGNPGDFLRRDNDNNVVFQPYSIANTGDYYVDDVTGVDIPSSGSVIQPFKTIGYAQALLMDTGVFGKTIKVLGGNYAINESDTVVIGATTYFTGRFFYQGTIEGQEGAIVTVNKDFNAYLIDSNVMNNGTIVKGQFQFLIYNGRFINNTQSYTLGGLTVEAKSVYSTNNIPIINFQSQSVTSITGIAFSAPNSNVQELLLNEDLTGAWFSLSNCSISTFMLSFKNDAVNGGTTIQNTSFYGTTNFSGKSYHLKVGKSNQLNRPAAIINCSFDIVSLDAGIANSACLVISEVDTIISLSRSSFSRKSDPTKAIFTNFNCTIAMYQVISAGLMGGTGMIDQVLTNQYNYISSTISGLRF